MDTIGFIGLGAMGAPMAQNLSETGCDLILFDTATGRMNEVDGDPAENPRDVAEQSKVIIVMVPDDAAVETVFYGKNGVIEGLDETKTVIQMSTVSQEAVQEAADATLLEDAVFIDAPVSGTVGPAENGTLTILAAGDEDTVDDVRPILAAMGEPVMYCGDVGQGTAMKLFINLLLGTMMESFAEALVFGQKQGLDTDQLFEVIESGPLQNTLYTAKGKMIRNRDFDPQFPVKYLNKDLSLALTAAKDLDIPLPVTAAAREATQATKALGYGDEDMAAVIRWLEDVVNVDVE